jgi:hypothetical protein
LRIIKKKTLDDISKKIDKAEEHAQKIEEISLYKEENEKLRRFDLYHAVRKEKYVRQGGDPTFGNLDACEQSSEEVEYYLSYMLNDYTPEERYRQQKEMYYFHPSYIEMEKLAYWEDRARAKYCTGYQCVPDCPYYEQNGRIEDEQVVKEFIDSSEILEIEDYKKELGEELIQSILNDWNHLK